MTVSILAVTPMNSSLGAIGSHVRYADNLVGIAGSYRPLSVQERGSNLSLTGGPANSLHAHLYPTGAGTSAYTGDLSTVFAGTKTRIYTVSPTAAADVSRAANYAQTVGDEPCAWSFCSYGADIVATNYVDEVQYRAGNAGLFANLITSAFKPQARYAAVARTALILANLEGSAGAGTGFSDEYAWSVFGNAASFDPAGGAGRQRSLAKPGQITGLAGGEFFRLLKSTSMSGVNYTGSSVTPWREDLISGSIGTPFGKSIVETKEGEIAFWGGDGFYKQFGMNPPQRIGRQLGWELVNYGTPGTAGAVNRWNPLKLVSYPVSMLTEDKVIHGARCARTGIVFWFIETEASTGFAAKVDGILWDPDADLWSFASFPRPVVAAAAYPDLAANFITSGLVGLSYDGTNHQWFRFGKSPDATELAKITWAIQPIALDGAEQPVTVRIRGVMPLFTWDVDADHTTPPNLTVNVVAYDDPYANAISGGQPRTAATTIGTNNSEWGWMNEPVLGALFAFELEIPTSSCRIPAITALAVDYEVIP